MSAPEQAGAVAFVVAIVAAFRARLTAASVVEGVAAVWSWWRSRRVPVSPIVEKPFVVAKELSDVGQLLVNVVEDLLADKSWAEVGLGNGAALKEALDGFREIPAEFTASPRAVGATIGVTLGGLAEVIFAHQAKAKAAKSKVGEES